jgi:ribose 5-phosphate isomerase B
VAKLVRLHNNANIICIPARFVALAAAQEMIDIFMATAFEGGRHQNRINKMAC